MTHHLIAAFASTFALWTSCRAQIASAPQTPESTQPSAPPNSTKTNALTWNFESDVASRYVFRGVAASRGAVVQPGLYASKRGYTLGLWGNFNATRRGGEQRRLNEINVTFSKDVERGQTTVSPGVLLYFYPRTDFPSTGELSLNLSKQRGKTAIFSNNYLDFRRYKGAYFGDIGLSRGGSFGSKATGEAKISVGFASAKYNRAALGSHLTALNVLAVDLSLTYALNEQFYLRPHISLTRVLNGKLRQSVDEPTLVFGGVALGSDF